MGVDKTWHDKFSMFKSNDIKIYASLLDQCFLNHGGENIFNDPVDITFRRDRKETIWERLIGGECLRVYYRTVIDN